MIIDAHNHPDWHKHNFKSFIKNMDDNNIDKTWILSWEAPSTDYEPYYTTVFNGSILSGQTGSDLAPFSRCLAYKQKAPALLQVLKIMFLNFR